MNSTAFFNKTVSTFRTYGVTDDTPRGNSCVCAPPSCWYCDTPRSSKSGSNDGAVICLIVTLAASIFSLVYFAVKASVQACKYQNMEILAKQEADKGILVQEFKAAEVMWAGMKTERVSTAFFSTVMIIGAALLIAALSLYLMHETHRLIAPLSIAGGSTLGAGFLGFVIAYAALQYDKEIEAYNTIKYFNRYESVQA